MENLISRINWVDVVTLIILLRTTYIGLDRGFSVEIFKFLGIILALAAGLNFYRPLSQFLAGHSFLPISLAQILSFLAVVFISVLLFKVIQLFFNAILKTEFVKWLDKIGGLILGIVRGILICALLFITLLLLPWNYPNYSIKQRSLSGSPILKVAETFYRFTFKFYPGPDRALELFSPK